MKTSFHLYLIALACISALLSPSLFSQGQVIDRIEVIADDSIILGSEIERGIIQAEQEFLARGLDIGGAKELREEVTESLILNALQLSKARQIGIAISEENLIDAALSIAQQNQITLDELKAQVQEQGDDFSAFLAELRDDLMIRNYQQTILQRSVRISEEEITRFLLSQEAQDLIDNEYLVSYITLPLSDEGEATRDLIMKALKNDQTFSSQARKYSQARNAAQGGSLSWRRLTDLPEIFAENVIEMNRGDVVSDVIRGSNLMLVELTDIRGSAVEYGDQYNVQHILVVPDEIMTEDTAKTFIQTLKFQVEGGEDFGLLARTHSDDTLSQNDGGELGWISASQLPPPLNEEILKLKAGDISQPLRTENGWHIMQYTDKREINLTTENLRNRALNIIFSMRYDEELNRHLKQVRGEAYVRYLHNDPENN